MVYMTRAALYLRISQDRTGQQAGIDRQRADCEKLAAARGWTITGIYADNDVSAFSRKPRPEFERLVADIEAKEIDAVVCWATDRLYRRTTDLDRLVDVLAGIEVATVKSGDVDLSNADGRLRARLLADVAQHESEKKGERVKAAAEQRAKAGRYGGGARRFGYTKHADELIPEEADAVRWAYAHVVEGGSLEAIAKEWRRRGLKGPRGADFTGVVVRDVLLRPMNAGIAVYYGQEVGRTDSPTIIDEDTFRTVRAILTDPKRRTRRGRPTENLLSGILRCKYCGKPVTASSRSDKAGNRTMTYACRERCVSRRRFRFDDLISELVITRLEKDPEGYAAPATPATTDNSVAIEAEKMRTKLEGLAELFAAGDLEPSDYAAATRKARSRLAELESRLASMAGTPATAKLLQGSNVRQAWEAYDMEQKRNVIREVIDHIVVGRGTSGKFTAGDLEVIWKDPA